MATKHLTPESRIIINQMLIEDKPIKEIVTAVKTAMPGSTISYDNVYNYKKRQEKAAAKETTITE